MNTFKDAAGHERTIVLTVGNIANVRRTTGIDLGKGLSAPGELAGTLFRDPETFADVVWQLVNGAEPGKDKDAFLATLDGPTIERATEAMLNAIVDFFHRSTVAKALKHRLSEQLKTNDRKAAEQISSLSATDTQGSQG